MTNENQLTYDLITVGRVGMDLFSQNIGKPFVEIEGFETGVGGSPSNIAIGSSRLGLTVGLLTAVSPDPVGNFVLYHLAKEGIDTSFVQRKTTGQTGLAVVGVQPPDRFPLTFYRENPADIYLSLADVDKLPLAITMRMLLSGTALSRGSAAVATLYAAEQAKANGVILYSDLDLRPDQWRHPLEYGVMIRRLWPHLDVVIGTEEELYAALSPTPELIMSGGQVDAAMQQELTELLAKQPYQPTIVRKLGAAGVSITPRNGETIHVPTLRVTVLNTVGAGDAFASGLLYGRAQGWSWEKSGRFANACGAIVVTRHGCSTAMPTVAEVESFLVQNEM